MLLSISRGTHVKTKVAIAVSSALMTALLAQSTSAFEFSTINSNYIKQLQPTSVNKSQQRNIQQTSRFIKEPQLAPGEYTYIVRLKDAPVATYKGEISGLKATSPTALKRTTTAHLNQLTATQPAIKKRIDTKSPSVQAYKRYLEKQQNQFISSVSQTLGTTPKVVYRYQNAVNGLALRLTQDEAERIAKLPNVAFVERDIKQHLLTDTGPTFIGATNVWQGEGQTASNMGEGVIIGVLDTGVNTDHPSFADIGDDGYDHTNPFGAGNYVGDCANGFANLCNDKLIGVRHYSDITDDYSDSSVFGDTPPPANGEDYNGHGSHTASTSGGNILYQVPELDASTGQVEGDGVNNSGFKFDRISGVAPHANIISYQVCSPGESDDTYSGCPNSAIVKAIDDAITDGVDVINFSISGGQNPWTNTSELSFLAAQEAGIFVAVAAGNDGPNANTTDKSAPWYTAVAASTHGRTIGASLTFNNQSYDFQNGSGPALKSVITGTLKAAKTLDANNEEGCDAFATDAFKDSIAFISRGTCTFEQKVTNATNASATAVVVYNNKEGDALLTMSGLEDTTIPAIFVSENSGIEMLAAIEADPSLTITIDPAKKAIHGQGDTMASFSSRGPNSYVDDIMTPSVAAPGVNIYAAYADQMFGHDETTPAPSDFAYLGGTSMATPHVAGAAAVLKSSHPTWTPDNIRSALMMTATIDLKKEDATTPADFFDMGAGRIRVDLADKAGLVMNETADNYRAANPATGGDPKTLNIPSVSNAQCVGSCSWTRTVTATSPGDWTVEGVSISNGLNITVSPVSFSLNTGESQTLTISVDTTDAAAASWAFGQVIMQSSAHPTAHIPVSVKVSNGDIPKEINITAHRNADSFTTGPIRAIEITDFTARGYDLTRGDTQSLTIKEDSDNSGVYDDTTDGTKVITFTIPNNAKRYVAEITASDSPDLDMYLGIDSNGDGIPQESEQIAMSATSTALELIDILSPEAGNYWLMIQNWQASATGATDNATLVTALIDDTPSDKLTITTDQSAIAALTDFDLNVAWNIDGATTGEKYYGAFDLGSSADKQGNIGVIAVNLYRDSDDVSIMSNASNRVNIGDDITYTVTIDRNYSQQDRDYQINITLPDSLTLDPTSVSAGATISGNSIDWHASQPTLANQPNYYTMANAADDESCAIPDLGQGSGYIDLAALGTTPNDISGDDQTATFNIATSFLGKTYDQLSVTEDGFIYFSGTRGSSSWVNQRLPDTNAPNNLIAALWRDMEAVKSETSGITVATLQDDLWTVVEYDDMQHHLNISGVENALPPGSISDLADFEIILNNQTGNFYLAYDNIVHDRADDLGVTVGYENANGTSGLSTIYSPSIYGGESGNVGTVRDISSGTVYCYTLTIPGEQKTLSFTAKVNENAAAGNLAIAVTHSANNGSISEQTSTTTIEVEGAPTAIISGVTSAVEGSNVTLSATNSTDPNGDTLTYNWEQLSGTNVSFNSTAASITFIAPNSPGQSLSFKLTVDDGHGNIAETQTTVQITQKPKQTNSSGGGSAFWLLLALPLILVRKRKLM